MRKLIRDFVKRVLCMLVVFTMLGTYMPLSTYAANTGNVYETTRDNAPVWSEPYKNTKLIKEIEDEGTIITLIESVKNKHGNLWYKVSGGGYIYSGNVKEHTKHEAVMCGVDGGITYEVTEKKHIKRETSSSILCRCGYVIEKSKTSKISAKHEYVDGECECGILEMHEHKGAQCAYYTVMHNVDEKKHYIVTTELDLCSCGHIMDENVTKKKVKHEIQDGRCECGYRTEGRALTDKIHITLGICGMSVEPIATLCDAADIVVSLADGDMGDALLSFSATLIPFVSSGVISSSSDVAKQIDNVYDVQKSFERIPGRYWVRTISFQDTLVHQRDDLFDPDFVSTWKYKGKSVTGTNKERMLSGRAPIGYDGKSVELHHLTQRASSTIAEISSESHHKWYNYIHINAGTCLPSGVDHASSAWTTFRKNYWKNRALDFVD